MATSGGPDIERDGLVFGMDTGYGVFNQRDQLRFFKGGPVDNIWSDSYGQSVNNVSSWSAPMQSTAGLTQSVRSETWNGNRIWQLERTAGNAGTYDSWRRCVSQPLAGSYPSTRFVTMKICTPFDDPVSELALHTGGGNSSHDSSKFTKIPINEVPKDAPYRDKWYEFHISANWSSTTVVHCVGLAFKSGNASTFLATEPMYYASTHKTPFTPTDRSSTQSLIDLTKSTNIDVSNVSFDSTGQPTFDGTDDYFTTSGLSIGTPSSVSFETVIKFDGTLDSNDRKVFHWDKTGTTNGVAQIRKGTNSGRLMYQHHDGTTWYTLSVDGVVTSDTYIHILVVHNSTTATMYKNGVQVGTASVGNLEYTNAGELLIGYRAASEYWKGGIPIVKVYNRALSADEVQQNYNAYKNRFNL